MLLVTAATALLAINAFAFLGCLFRRKFLLALEALGVAGVFALLLLYGWAALMSGGHGRPSYEAQAYTYWFCAFALQVSWYALWSWRQMRTQPPPPPLDKTPPPGTG